MKSHDFERKMFQNHTSKYLSLIVNGFNKVEKNHIIENSKSIRMYALSDADYEIAKNKKYKYHLFLLFNTKGAWIEKTNRFYNIVEAKTKFKHLLIQFRKSKMYVDDYKFDNLNNHLHVLVLAIPEIYHHAYNMLLESKYSKMYNSVLKKQICLDRYTQGPISYKFGVLNKTSDYKKEFEKFINKTFNTDIIIDDDRELDLPININNEILNYHKYEKNEFENISRKLQ